MPGPTVQFLGGVREIGGNKLVVEDGGDRVLFDFGPSFDPKYEQFYIDYLQPRSTSPVRDLLEFELIPWVPGLYGREALAGIEDRYEPPRFGGVFVSHAHVDHAGYLKHIDPEIPLHVGKGTKVVLEAIERSSQMRYGEHVWKMFVDGAPIRIGNLEVVPLPVDHSVPHAYGFLVRTRAGTLVYTGDFRQHGPRAKLTHDFLAAAEKEEPVALAIEGTRAGVDKRKNFTEDGVRTGIQHQLESSGKLALVSCYPRDVDRLGTLYRAAVESDRDLIVPLKAAHLLRALADDEGLNVPVPGRAPNLRVYRRPKKVYQKWEQELLDEEAVDAAWVRQQAKRTLLLLDMHQFTELIDVRPERGSAFIRSMSEPFSEEDGNEAVLQNWIAHFGLSLHQFHASGHCSASELTAAIRAVGPKTLFPIHTEHPEAFVPGNARLTPPEIGVIYDLATGKALA